MFWVGDLYLKINMINNLNPVLDFFLYGVDLLELPAIVAVTMSFIAKLRHKFK